MEATQPAARASESDVERRVQAALDAARKRWDREDTERRERDAASQQAQARETERAALRAKWQRWKQQGDTQAGTEVLEALGAPLDEELTEATLRPHLERAQQELRDRLWTQHMASFGVNEPDETLRNAPDFPTLNAALLARADSDTVLDAAWENPKIQERHTAGIDAALKAAREAAFNDGVASAIGQHAGPEANGASNGSPESLEDIERAWAEHPDDPTLLDKYRRIVRPARGYR